MISIVNHDSCNAADSGTESDEIVMKDDFIVNAPDGFNMNEVIKKNKNIFVQNRTRSPEKRKEFYDSSFQFEGRNTGLNEIQQQRLSRNCQISEHLSFPKATTEADNFMNQLQEESKKQANYNIAKMFE